MGLDLVVIAGIKRSASTAMWNICRIAMKHDGYRVIPRGQSLDVNELGNINDRDIVLCKIHPFDQQIALNADHIFVTDRADEEIIESLERMWGGGDPWRLSRLRGDLSKWMLWTTPNHYFYYRGSIAGWTHRVIDLLGVDADPYEVKDEVDNLEPPEEGQDPVTKLFAGHISE